MKKFQSGFAPLVLILIIIVLISVPVIWFLISNSRPKVIPVDINSYPAKLIYEFNEAIKKNDQIKLKQITNYLMYEKTQKKDDTDFSNFFDSQSKVKVTKLTKLKEGDYIVYYVFNYSDHTSGGTMRIQKLNELWKIVNAPACNGGTC